MTDELELIFDEAVEAFDDLTEDVRDKKVLDSKEVAAIINAANEAIAAAQMVIYGE